MLTATPSAILVVSRRTAGNDIANTSAHTEIFTVRGKKYQTCWIVFSWPREAKFSHNFKRTREEQLSKRPREAESSAISSSVRQA